MKLRLDIIYVLLYALLVVPAPSDAQTSAFHGRVLDQTGAAITDAQITVISEPAGTISSITTDGRGSFRLALTPGRYTLTVTAAGFLDVSARLTIGAALDEARDFTLQVAGFHDAISVNAPSGYSAPASRSATKTPTPLSDIPQSITVVNQELMRDQLMMSIADVMRYVPGITTHQGENNRDQIIVRGQNTSADFFVDGVRDDVQYYRDLYNLDRVEALKGPNAMIFGRGGAGGIVNRITKEALPQPIRSVALQAGSFDQKRLTADLGRPLSKSVAFRLNGMYEHSGSFRDSVGLERYGVTPTITISPGENTKVRASYEYLHDGRVADRGISSFGSRPVDLDIATYYGNPADSHVRADVGLSSVDIEHRAGRVTVKNHSLYGDYDRFYQNFVPGAVTATGAQVALSSYNNATKRRNLFNQTDLTSTVSAWRIRHTILVGTEFGRQLTDNFRNTGFFNNTATSIAVPFGAPTITTPVTFRQSATDADNHLHTRVAAAYVQDQAALSRHVQFIGGIRLDRFDLTYHNHRNGDTLQRVDALLSPRAGVVIKPFTAVSLYSSYGVSHLPSSGDQFSSLTTVTQQVKPEKFANYEAGIKWDAMPDLSVTSAVYRLNRTNTRATDPNDATRIIQTGSSRTNGFELGLTGRLISWWRVAGGYAWQDAYVSSATTAALAGARIAQVPEHVLSLWNSYQLRQKLGAGLGLVGRTAMFAAIDNTVQLPGYVRADAAAYYAVGRRARLQINVENLFNTKYYNNADNNTNISPGSPRALRVGLSTTF